jgi:hypothetical protein
MESRKREVLALKRKNLDDRIKMAGDITQDQIKDLRG